MAEKIIRIRVSDLSGEELGEGGQTIEFGVGSDRYTIDLSDKEAGKFYDALKPYMDSAAKTGGRGVRKSSSRSSGTRTKEETAAIKRWADSQGIEYPQRGRLPQALIDQYNQSLPPLK